MSVTSYLIFSKPGSREELTQAFDALPQYELVLSDNTDLHVLIAEHHDKEDENFIKGHLESLTMIEGYSLVYGEVEFEKEEK